jgi:hypothetical protein
VKTKPHSFCKVLRHHHSVFGEALGTVKLLVTAYPENEEIKFEVIANNRLICDSDSNLIAEAEYEYQVNLLKKVTA